jgi:hypothetical protein
MKSISSTVRTTFLLLGCLFAVLALQARAEGGRVEVALAHELRDRIGVLPTHLQVHQQLKVSVEFTVNEEGQIRVQEVGSELPALTAYVKERLRESSLGISKGFAGKSYRITLKVEDMR